jgi:histidyl-tRNA synthetase
MSVLVDEPKRRLQTRSRALLDDIVAIAEHYGFRDTRELFHRRKIVLPSNFHGSPAEPVFRDIDEYIPMKNISSLREALEYGLLRKSLREPLLVYRLEPQRKLRGTGAMLSLEVMGMTTSFSEALVIQTAAAILEEAGERNVSLELNSLGDRETLVRYLRECTLYYRKYAPALHVTCREMIRKHPLTPLSCAHETCTELREDAPKPIAYLNETGRRHFKEVLEYLEIMKIPYRINESLVKSHLPYTKTIFQMHPQDEIDTPSLLYSPTVSPLMHGGRYDDFARKIGARADIPVVGASLMLRMPISSVALRRSTKKPRAYFIQIGPEARRRSLLVLEILRRANIPIRQSVGLDKLSGQLMLAESMGLPYTIIMGHKEAVEGSVIVRRTDTRSQETVPITELARYTKLIR